MSGYFRKEYIGYPLTYPSIKKLKYRILLCIHNKIQRQLFCLVRFDWVKAELQNFLKK